MTASDLHELIVRMLARKSGGSARRWRMAVGPIYIHDMRTHAHCNWSVRPSGAIDEVAAIETLLDSMRPDHPMVTAD